jgi:hypothetical protein
MPKNFNPHLQAAILEAVENQLADNDPPETRKTYERLIREGRSEKDAKKLIGCVVVAEIFSVRKQESLSITRGC